MTALAFAALVVAWGVLHRSGRSSGWGYVGGPPSRLEVAARRAVRSLERLAGGLDKLGLAARDADRAFRRLAEALAQGPR